MGTRGTRAGARFALFIALFAFSLSNLFVGAAPDAPVAPTSPNAVVTIGGSVFGLDTHIATRFGVYGKQNGPMDMAVGTGAGWIREEIRWDWVEHPLGKWDWGFTDEMVQDALGRNFNILGLLGYNNSAQTAGTVNYTVPDMAAWKNYLLNTIYRYKDKIHVWEVWNEPDNPYFWNGSVADYVNLMRVSYDYIKSIDPTAVVINGAGSNLDLVWFNQFLDQGGAPYTDALAFHPYPLPQSLDNGDYQKIVLARFKDIQAKTGKPWWFTEIGWSSAPNGGVGSEQAQASYMVRQYVESLDYDDLDVRHIFWYDFHDDGTDPGNVENNFGLIHNDWQTPKMSYNAYQQMTLHLSGATPLGTVDSGAGIAYRFNRNGTIVDVVWGNGRTNLPTAATQAQTYDMLGTALPTEVSGGQIHVDIGGLPVYVEHTGTPASLAPPPPPTSTFSLPPQGPQGPYTRPGYVGQK